MNPKVLVADADPASRLSTCEALKGRGMFVAGACDGTEALARLRDGRFDVAVMDARLPGPEGVGPLGIVRQIPNPPHVVVVTAQSTMSAAIEAMKGGAYEYLCRPFDPDLLADLVLRAARDRAAGSAPRLADGPDCVEGTRTLYGRSPSMERVFAAIDRAARSPHAVLIGGESGTGKALVARILHAGSDRAAGPFVAVHAAARPPDRIEAEVFGPPRGSPPGAGGVPGGRLGEAEGGTLFLDEVGDLPLPSQARLLQVVERRAVAGAPGHEPLPCDVRVIAASTRDLAEEVRAGSFRGDLYYRLGAVTIEIPPLRERVEDIPLLAEWLLDRHARTHGEPRRVLSEPALQWLCDYTWPGNVRELESTLVRAATFATEPTLQVQDLAGPTGLLDRRSRGGETESFEAVVAARLRPVVRSFPEPPGDERSDLYSLVMGTCERVLLDLALRRTGGNQAEAARLLGIGRSTLRRKLESGGGTSGPGE